MARFQLVREYPFEAAHRNTQGDEKTSRVHGHNYIAAVLVEDEIDPVKGWFLDYGDMDRAVAPILSRLDHHYINEVIGGSNARIPNIEAWLFGEIARALPCAKRVMLRVDGEFEFRLRRLPPDPVLGFPERLAFGFEAAHSLPAVPKGHKCAGLHGHSFRMEAAAADSSGFDALASRLRELYDVLDHRYLNDVEGLANPTSENIALWAASKLAPRVPSLHSIIVRETPTAHCLYRVPPTA